MSYYAVYIILFSKRLLIQNCGMWPSDYGLFTRKAVEWLHGLCIHSIESYLRLFKPLDEEIKLLSKELEGIAEDYEAVKLLMTSWNRLLYWGAREA
jgi:hypothetical protein